MKTLDFVCTGCGAGLPIADHGTIPPWMLPTGHAGTTVFVKWEHRGCGGEFVPVVPEGA